MDSHFSGMQRARAWKTFTTMILLCLGAGAIGGANTQALAQATSGYKLPNTPPANPNAPEDVKVLRTFSKVFVNIAKETRPSLVFIETMTRPQDQAARPQRPPPGAPRDLFEFFFRQQPQGPRSGAGSGFIVDLKGGYVITNNHVAAAASEITVTTFDNRKFKAKLVGAEPAVDLAVLKLENFSAGGLKQATLGDSDAIEVGDWVVALGAPFGLPQTLTVGVVSALGRGNLMGGMALEDFIQTDAAINPGNSGGPLLNIDGKVVGINTMISSPTGSSAGIGFAVTSNMARLVAEQLITSGKFTRGYLGLEGQDTQELSSEVASTLGVKGDLSGALVQNVVPAGPADKAGLKPYDIIVAVGNASIANFQQLRTRVAFQKPGTTVKVQFIRDGKRQETNLVVGTFPSERDLAASSKPRTEAGGAEVRSEFGFAAVPVSPQMKRDLGVKAPQGFLVREVTEESPAARAGLRRGDVIVEVNRRPVKSESELVKVLGDAAKSGRDVLLLIERQGRNQLLVVPLG
jgi:serine protease Do